MKASKALEIIEAKFAAARITDWEATTAKRHIQALAANRPFFGKRLTDDKCGRLIAAWANIGEPRPTPK